MLVNIVELLRDSCILGIDVYSRDLYAYAVYSSGNIIDKGIVNSYELYRLIKKYKPSIIAIDNVREILEIGKDFIKKLAKLPFTINIIQVTMVEPGKEISLENLVKDRLNIDVGKLDPESTAIYLTLLASQGVGSIVKLYEPETKIIVKASISTNQGGMSRNRFERNIAHRVKQIVDDIKRVLDNHKIDYDLFYQSDSEALRSATFIVYASKAIVRSLIKPIRSIDIKVSIESIPTQTIRYAAISYDEKIVETSIKDRYVIVGVDPGIVTGLAILDLNGNVLHLYSGKNLSRRKAIQIITQYGIPLIIAVDSSRIPEYAKKLSSMLNSILYSPDRDLSVSEKSEIVAKLASEFKITVKDPHQRDALAAAYKAYLSVKSKIDKVDDYVRVLSVNVPINEVKALVIRGYSIKQAIDQVLSKYSEDKVRIVVIREDKRRDIKELRKIEEEYEQRVKMLVSEIEKLKSHCEELKYRIQELENERYLEVKKDTTIRALEARISNLEYELESSKMKINKLEKMINDTNQLLIKYLKGDVIMGIKVEDLNELNYYPNMGGNVVPVISSNILSSIDINYLIHKGLTKIIIDNYEEEIIKYFTKQGIAIALKREVEILDIGSIVFIDKDKLEEKYKEITSKFSREIDEDTLVKLISSYRRSRNVKRV